MAISCQFRITLFYDTRLRNGEYGMSRVSYEPELSPFLYAYFRNKFILSKSGNAQISGENPSNKLIA